jgi:tetratricopeptide (TPR) repeat protein
MARLDGLGPSAKETAQIAAALGREFAYDLLAAITSSSEVALQSSLDRLVGAGLVFQRGLPPQSTYSFKHALVQDAAYSTLLRTQRQSLHGRIAARLKERFAEKTESQPELLALHLTEAGLTDEAITYWSKAGQQAVARFANKEAEEHLTTAIELLQKLPEDRARNEKEVDLRLALAVPLTRSHGDGSEAVEACAKRAKQLSEELDDHPARFAAYRLMWNSSFMRQPMPRAVALARELMSFAREGSDQAQLAVAYRALAYSLFVAGELSEADALFSECGRIADTVPDTAFGVYGEHPSMIARVYGGQTRCLIGFPDQGALLCDAGISHARARGDPHSLAWALVGSGQVRIILRDTDEAERLLREALDLAHEHRMPEWIGFAQALLGFALCSNGDPQTGIKLQDEGMRSLHAAGSMLMTTRLRVNVAASLIGIGELERARLHLAAGQSHRESHGERVVAAELERVEAELLRREGAPSQTVAAQLNKAISTARSQGARLFELRAATNLARLWRDVDRRAEAHALLGPIYGWFTEGFTMPDLKEAKALLGELAGPTLARSPSG